jgi:hypothetical protein
MEGLLVWILLVVEHINTRFNVHLLRPCLSRRGPFASGLVIKSDLLCSFMPCTLHASWPWPCETSEVQLAMIETVLLASSC